jgi:hypothetical protein
MPNTNKVEVDEAINQLNHLTLEQKEDFRKVSKQHTKLFDRTLGVYPHRFPYQLDTRGYS